MAVAALACKPAESPVKLPVSTEPQIPATVITIQTTLQPQNKTYTHWVVIANGRARSGDEVDRWRLFDLDQRRITFVDDVAKTYYTESIDQTIASRNSPFISTGAKRVIQGVETAELLMRFGEYQRELWIGSPSSIPPNLYGMMNASDETLSKIKGFPLVDHAELPYGNSKLVVDKSVVKIEQRNVPESWLNLRADYKEVTAPGEHRPPASSPPPSRSTRAAG